MKGYRTDSWCIKLRDAAPGMPTVQEKDGLLFIGTQLVIPGVGSIQEPLFCLVHDSLGHFRFEKLYGSWRESCYWPKHVTRLGVRICTKLCRLSAE